jgi:hypothetical protein
MCYNNIVKINQRSKQMTKFIIENDFTEEKTQIEANSKEEAIKIFHSFINKVENHKKDYTLFDENRSRIAFSTVRK